ncbi:MAG: hypothetical protein ISS50_04355 [Anaerolineae bacterium]|nr:hypothetical protein [Anaerolineae bacterium]
MSRGLRTVGVIAVVVLLAVITPASSGVGRGEASAVVVIISPPSGLALPVGQAVEVRYRIVGAATVLELWDDDILLAVDQVQSGQEVAHAWAPASPGPHCLMVRALDEGSTLLTTAERCVDGLPRGSPVRLRAER